MKTSSLIAGGVCALVVSACASTPIPADKLTRSSSAIAAAETLDAKRDPNAALHLTLAKEELAKGKKLLQDADNERAAGVLSRAEADAVAARELARAKTAHIEVEKTRQNVEQQRAAIGGGQ